MRTLLTPSQVDDLLQYPPGRAARLARQGRLPAIRLPDGSIRFREDDIEKLLTAEQGGPVVQGVSDAK
jgi:predicted site-specific integrase-resolvase